MWEFKGSGSAFDLTLYLGGRKASRNIIWWYSYFNRGSKYGWYHYGRSNRWVIVFWLMISESWLKLSFRNGSNSRRKSRRKVSKFNVANKHHSTDIGEVSQLDWSNESQSLKSDFTSWSFLRHGSELLVWTGPDFLVQSEQAYSLSLWKWYHRRFLPLRLAYRQPFQRLTN